MHQISAATWNLVAELAPTKTQIGRLFRLDPEQMNQAEEREAERLEAEGYDPDVVLAYLEVAPYLVEREAIAKAKGLRPDNLNLQAIPEVNTIQAAVLLSTRECLLTSGQQKQLTELLSSLNSLETSDEPNELQTASK